MYECEKLLQQNENNIKARHLLSNAYFKIGEFDECLRECKQLIQQDENNIEARHLLSNAYFQLDQFDDCLRECHQLLQYNEKDINARLLLSDVHLFKEEFDEALRHAEYAQQIELSARTWGHLGNLYIDYDSEKALFAIDKALEIAPNNLFFQHLKFIPLLDLNRLEEAEEQIKIMKNLFDKEFPNEETYSYLHFRYLSTAYYGGLGLIYFAQGKYKQSLINIDKGLKLNTQNPGLLLSKGVSLLLERKNYAAIEVFKCAQEIRLNSFELHCAIGFAYLYNKQYELAVEALEQAFNLSKGYGIATAFYDAYYVTAIALYDAYIGNNEIIKANKLVDTCQISGFMESTTSSPRLFAKVRPSSYIIVYIWNPKHDRSPQHRDADYGHAAIKVVHNGESFYFSWFPSGNDYTNEKGIPRATPGSYGAKRKIKTPEKATSRLRALFKDIPLNGKDQIEQILMRKSDKEEFRRNATFKFFFKGIHIDRLLVWWKTLLKIDTAYCVNSYNCCDVVLHSLQFALDEEIQNINIKTSRMRENKNYDPALILEGHKYEISPQSGFKSTTIYQYCFRLAQEINQTKMNSQSEKDVPAIIVRYNRWHKRRRAVIKFDIDPLKFNPNWMTTNKKIGLEDIYSNLINRSFSQFIFKNISELDDDIKSENYCG